MLPLQQGLRPSMLQAGAITAPGLDWAGHGAQIIDVPVSSLCNPGMMRDPCPQTAGAEGAADIEIEAGFCGQSAELARAK